MRRWVYVSRERTRTRLGREEVLAELSDYEDLSESAPERTWEYEVRGWLTRNRILFKADPPEYEVIEERYLSVIWLVACCAAYTAMLASDTLVVVLGAVCVFIAGFIPVVAWQGPVGRFWRESGSSGMDVMPIYALLPALLIGVVIEVFMGLSVSVAAGFGLGSFAVYWLAEPRIVRWSKRWMPRFVEFTDRLPHVVIGYSAFVLSASITTAVSLLLSYTFAVGLWVSSWVVVAAHCAVFGVGWIGVVFGMYRSVSRYNRRGFVSEGQKGSRLMNTGFGVVAVLVSVFVAGLSILWVERVLLLYSVDRFSGVAIGLAGGWPVLYVVGGLLYQSVGLSRLGVAFLFRNELSEEIGEGVSADVYVLGSEVPVAGAVSLGVSDFVVVSDSLVEELSGEELEAVLLHEEGHIVRGDSWLAFLTGVLSPLVLTGKNVLFSVMGFRQRELAADRYAAEKVGREQMVEALEAMEELEQEAVGGGSMGAVPTMVSFGSGSGESRVWERLFGFFYGDFGVTEAHPGIEERKEALRD